jgi:DNA mismatch endonuclease (patch repair protein)
MRRAIFNFPLKGELSNLPLIRSRLIGQFKLLIFVDGSFWHGYDWENRKQAIHSNREFWIAKIERNRQRDREVNAFYQSKGRTVLRFWDFEVKGEVGACIKRVMEVF